MATDYTVRFRGENRSLLSSARESDRAVGRLSGTVRRSGQNFRQTTGEMGKATRGALAGSGAFAGFARSIAFASTAFLGGAGLMYVLRGAITGASDLTEEINKSQVVFGSGAQIVLRWSKGTAVALGIARVEALKFAGTFGNMLVPMGFAREEAARMSKGLVNLAADMASFNNAAPVEVLEALRAGLAGETEPLRRFGVFLNEARIAATAASLGLTKTTADLGKVSDAETKLSIARANHAKALRDYGAGTTQVASAQLAVSAAERGITAAMSGSKTELTAQSKAAAIYAIILKDTKDAQGDVARTSSSWANVQRRLKAVLIETQTAIGQGLLPLLAPLLRRFTAYVVTLQEGGARHQRFKEILAGSIKTITTVATGIGRIASAANRAAKMVGGWDVAFKLIVSGLLARQVWKLAGAFTGLAGGAAAGGAAGGIGLANTRAARLATLLGKLKTIGIIAVAIEVAINWDEINSFEDWRKSLSQTGASGIPRGVPGSGWLFDTGPTQGSPRERAAQRRAAARRARTNPSGPQYGRGGPNARTASPRGGKTYMGQALESGGHHAAEAARGYPAVDIFGPAGTPWLAPEDGRVVRHSGRGGTSGGFYGWSMYFVGEQTGWEYYFQHMQKNRAPLGRYKKGDVLGYVSHWSTNPRATHIHVGIKKSGRSAATPPPTAPTGATASPGGGPLTVGTRPGAPPTPKDLAPIRTTVGFIRKHLAQIIPPGLRKRISDQMRGITELLTGKVSAKEFAAAGKRLTALKALWSRSVDLSAAIRTVRAQVNTISEQIENLPAEARGKIRNQMAALRRDLGNVMSTAGLNAIKARLAKIAEAIAEAIQRAIDKVDAARDRLGNLFARIRDRILEVFDAQTDEMVAAARKPFEAMTAAEQALADLRSRRSAKSIENRIEDAQSKLDRAMRLGDPALIREAQRELEEARLDEIEAALERQAEIERTAADAAADAEEKRIRAERRELRGHLERRLDDIEEILDDESLTTDEKMAKIAAIMSDYGITFEAMGSLLGNAFASAFRSELDELIRSINEILDLLDAVRIAQGQEPLHVRVIPRRPIGGWDRDEDDPGMAEGGIAMRPTKTWVAEGGRPEGVIPLGDPRATRMLRDALGGGGGGGGTFVEMTLVVEGQVVHSNDLWREGAREIERVLGNNAQPPLRVRPSASAKLGQRRQRK